MKAQIELQFNWIFVIIIGVVLLGFFFAIINSQAGTTEQRISISQSRYFETIVTSSGQEPGTFKKYDLANFELSFFCDSEQETYFYTLSDIQARDTKYDLLFSPQSLIGKDLLTWTQSWELPYKIAVFQYVTNSDHAFIFYNYSELLDRDTTQFIDLYESFAKNLSVYVQDSSYQPTNNLNMDSYRYIFLKNELPPKSEINIDLVDEGVVVLIDRGERSPSIFDYGDLYFISATRFEELLANYDPVDFTNPTDTELLVITNALRDHENDDAISKSSYLGRASLYASLFVDDVDFYDCNMQKAMERLRLQTLMHYQRIESVKDKVSLNCAQQLGVADEPPILRESNRFPRKRLLTIAETLDQPHEDLSIEEIYDHLTAVKVMNADLELSGACPVIY